MRACEVREAVAGRASALEAAGRYDDLVAVLRITCFAGATADACGALDAFRGRARDAAVRARQASRCRAAATMIRAASQGPADLARAGRLEEAPVVLEDVRKCIDARGSRFDAGAERTLERPVNCVPSVAK